MGAGDLLRRLDRRLLPPVAGAMARMGRGPVRLRLLTAAALVSVGAVLLTAVWAVDQRPVPELPRAELLRVGVTAGQSVPGYVESSRDELAALVADSVAGTPAVETYALVTLADYLSPTRLTPLLGGVAVSEVFARVPLRGVETEAVRFPAYRIPADVDAGMAHAAARKEAEAAELRGLSAALTGAGADERRLRRGYDDRAKVAELEALALRSGCACVYGAVVRTTPVTLDQIAVRPEVRAVDPAPEVRRLDHAVFVPPLPEQVGVVPPTEPEPPADLDPGPAASSIDPAASPTGEPGAPVDPPAPPVDPPSAPPTTGPTLPPPSPTGSPAPSPTGSAGAGPDPGGAAPAAEPPV